MIRAGRCRRLVMHGVAAVIPAVLCLIDLPQPVAAQQIQTRLPALQAPVSDNLEAQVLGRLSATGQYQPDDLPILARLAVLDSIAMMSNVRTDLRDTPAGSRLEGEIAAFWDSAQVLYEDFSSAPLDLTTLSRHQADSVDVLAAFRRLESTLGEFPEVSNGAAERLRDLSRLLGAMSSVMGGRKRRICSERRRFHRSRSRPRRAAGAGTAPGQRPRGLDRNRPRFPARGRGRRPSRAGVERLAGRGPGVYPLARVRALFQRDSAIVSRRQARNVERRGQDHAARPAAELKRRWREVRSALQRHF